MHFNAQLQELRQTCIDMQCTDTSEWKVGGGGDDNWNAARHMVAISVMALEVCEMEKRVHMSQVAHANMVQPDKNTTNTKNEANGGGEECEQRFESMRKAYEIDIQGLTGSVAAAAMDRKQHAAHLAAVHIELGNMEQSLLEDKRDTETWRERCMDTNKQLECTTRRLDENVAEQKAQCRKHFEETTERVRAASRSKVQADMWGERAHTLESTCCDLMRKNSELMVANASFETRQETLQDQVHAIAHEKDDCQNQLRWSQCKVEVVRAMACAHGVPRDKLSVALTPSTEAVHEPTNPTHAAVAASLARVCTLAV